MSAQHPSDAVARQLRALCWAVLVASLPVVLYFTTLGTWRLTHQRIDGGWTAAFFWQQAESMLVHARLDVDPAAFGIECFMRDERCYGYFGVTPSLVRIPFLGISRFFHSALTPVFLAAAILVAWWAAFQMLQRSLRTGEVLAPSRALVLGYGLLGALALGPGSTLLFLARPAVYEEAIAWGVAFFLLAMNHVWAWYAREARSLVPAVVFGILAANARPTAATACGVLGLLAMWWCRQDRFTGRPFRAALGLSLLPGLTAAAVFWLKLGTPVPSVLMNRHVQEAPHWKAILEQNGRRTGGAMFAPTALALYFRPDTVVSRSAWPIADFRFPHEPILWIPPLPVGGAYVERTASVTATMPLPWLLTVVMAIGAGTSWARERRSPHPSPERREEWTVAAGLFASALAMTALTVTTVGMTNRYLPDFYAISAVGVVFAHRRLLPWLHRHRALGALAGLVALALVVWSIVVNVSLTTQVTFY